MALLLPCLSAFAKGNEYNQSSELAMGAPLTAPVGGLEYNLLKQDALAQDIVPALRDRDMKSLAFITNRDSGDIAVLDTATDEIIGRVKLGAWVNPHMAMPMQNSNRMLLVAGSQANMFYVVNLDRGVIRSVSTDLGPEHFAVTPDGRQAYVANFDGGSVSVIDLMEGKEIARIEGFSEPHGVTFHPSLPKAYVPNVGAHEVGVINTQTHQLVKRIAVGELTKVAALNPDRYLTEIDGIHNVTLTIDGRYAYAADGDSNQAAVIDTQTDEVIKTLPVGDDPWRAYESPDGKWMLVPNNGDQTVSMIDAKNHKVVATVPGGSGMTGVNFANGGQKAYVIASKDSTVLVYDMATFRSKKLVIGKNLQLETASTTPDGRKIYLASSTDNSIYRIDPATDQIKRIANVGQSPWGVGILDGYNYCH